MLAIAWPGCTPPEPEVPPAHVKTVEAYGMKLDSSASPQDVVYVLLQALADDVRAAQAHEKEAQKAALNLTFSLAAYSRIEQRLANVGTNRKNALGPERARELYTFVNNWAPIVGHYIASFDADPTEANRKMRLIPSNDKDMVQILYDVCHAPDQADPALRQEATLEIELSREPAGELSYWRVSRIGYRGQSRPIEFAPTTQPPATQTAPADESH